MSIWQHLPEFCNPLPSPVLGCIDAKFTESILFSGQYYWDISPQNHVAECSVKLDYQYFILFSDQLLFFGWFRRIRWFFCIILDEKKNRTSSNIGYFWRTHSRKSQIIVGSKCILRDLSGDVEITWDILPYFAEMKWNDSGPASPP